MPMRFAKYATTLLCSFVCTLSNCRPAGFEIGGGGSVHHPPQQIIFGKATELQLEFSVWGEGSGKMSERWKEVTCHYRLNTEESFHSILMRATKEDQKHIYFSCELPAISDAGAASVTYYFDEQFDGVYNKRDEKTVSIKHEQGPLDSGTGRTPSDLAAGLIGTTWIWHQPSTLQFENDGVCILSPWKGGEAHTWKAISGNTIEVQSAASPPGWNRRYQIQFSEDLTKGTTLLYNERQQKFLMYSSRLRRIEP